MHIRFPSKLVAGDLIAITAPSTGVPPSLHPRLDLVIKMLEARGFRVIEGHCLRTVYKNKSADKILRAEELKNFLTNPEIKAILPPWGGELAMELLTLINFAELAKLEPKWFSGFSDLSTLHVPITTLSGWATLHGPNLMELAAELLDPMTQKIWEVLTSDREMVITQQSSSFYQKDHSDWIANPKAGLNLTEPTQWKRLDGKSTAIDFKGRLIGGCLETISRLAGTQFANLPQFYQQHAKDGVILYFESSELKPCELTRALLSLKMHGWFNHISGLLIGRNMEQQVAHSTQQNAFDAIHSVLSDLAIPILYDVDIGHVAPQLSLVNGALAHVFFNENGSTISQYL
ncbi:S66 family peptidase [Acinetobacter rongchengensis]|uniref:LD-carboxypeptidase n=1 Tax=Acinetobacter rongchengensis TaxID=2419601 RepID=A0A3A8F708_9GAMM|nr:S66 peptidase family protein [Acinetobacter rongchengensis]RKG38870.1 LD-carboxypeptidase [Acinetobacter rongchengensis]